MANKDKTHVTLYLLWQEYKRDDPDGYEYTQFCFHYNQFVGAQKPTFVLKSNWTGGNYIFVDFAGDTKSYIDTDTGEVVECQIFIATLPASDYGFIKAVPSQKLDDFISCMEDCYAEILQGCKDYPPQIPYLFWMSVVWRMAVGEMGMVLDGQHQEKLRCVLDCCLALKRDDIILKNSKLGHCAYSLYVANDTKDEDLGIYGTHEETKPYQALMGRYFINFYTSLSAAKSFIKAHNLPLEDLNDGTEPEKTGDLNFIEFWMVKRQILDLAWKNGRSIWNIGRSRQKTLSKMHPLPFSGANESGDIPLWFNSENPIVMNVPRSLRKIENWLKEHQDKKWTIEDASEELGYTPAEMKVMTDYWEMKEKERKVKIENSERIIGALMGLAGRI